MSTWYQIKDPGDLDISEDGEILEIHVTDAMKLDAYFGNTYLEVPIKLIANILNCTTEE